MTANFVYFRRRSTARKQRETRRSTQPVPTDLLQKIKQSDLAEEKEFEESTEITTKSKTDMTQSNENVKVQVTLSEGVTKNRETDVEKTQEDKKESEGKGGKTFLPIQSAYKPYNRPTSKLLSDEEEECRLVISEVLSSTPPSTSEQNSSMCTCAVLHCSLHLKNRCTVVHVFYPCVHT